MKKLMILTFLLCFVTNYCFGQTIQEIFKSFPSTYIPEMTNEAKDSNGTEKDSNLKKINYRFK